MKSLPNIEKSTFRLGSYVGYALGHLWHIRNTNGKRPNWTATTIIDGTAHVHSAHTLTKLSAKLAALDIPPKNYSKTESEA